MSRALDRHKSSFRDPAGFVFSRGGNLYRQINHDGQADFDHFLQSGLYQKLVELNLLVAHHEVKNLAGLTADEQRYKIIKPTLIPFNSYPYEWTFSQLRDAARLTLQIQKLALAHGMILKDASAYNVQFIGRQPIFIDTLSFRIHQPGDPWDGYKQFCEHFITPLAVASYSSLEIFKILRVFLDGLPLSLTIQLLPSRARFRRGLTTHIYLHAASQRRFAGETSRAPKKPYLKPLALNGLISSLERTINSLKPPKRISHWSSYYENTNYSPEAFADKQKIVADLLKSLSPKAKMVWDVGANDGTFSRLAAKGGAYTLSFDVDPLVVEQNYHRQISSDLNDKILPLVQDLANPSPALGWTHNERASLIERGPADVVLALALIHHLAIANTTPLTDIADFFSRISRFLIIEFIPRDDSKVQFLLRFRNHPFAYYNQQHFETAFGQRFNLIKCQPIGDSQRTIYLYRAKK